MTRKKKAEGDSPLAAEDAPQREPPGSAGTATETAKPPDVRPAENGQSGKPLISFRCQSDRTVTLEVTVFGTEKLGPNGKFMVQYALTISRQQMGEDASWHRSGAFRNHDVPVLLFLLNKAHDWVLLQRTEDSSIPF